MWDDLIQALLQCGVQKRCNVCNESIPQQVKALRLVTAAPPVRTNVLRRPSLCPAHTPFTHTHTPFTHTHTPFTHLKLGERHATVARGIKEGECSMASHSVPTDKRGLCIAREYRFDVFGSFQWVQTMIRLQQHNHHGRKRRPGDETRPACGV